MEEAGIEAPSSEPTPEQQVQMAQSEADMAQASADIAKAESETAMAQAKTAEAQAKIAEIEQAATIAGPGTIEETVRNLVADALAELLSQREADA